MVCRFTTIWEQKFQGAGGCLCLLEIAGSFPCAQCAAFLVPLLSSSFPSTSLALEVPPALRGIVCSSDDLGWRRHAFLLEEYAMHLHNPVDIASIGSFCDLACKISSWMMRHSGDPKNFLQSIVNRLATVHYNAGHDGSQRYKRKLWNYGREGELLALELANFDVARIAKYGLSAPRARGLILLDICRILADLEFAGILYKYESQDDFVATYAEEQKFLAGPGEGRLRMRI